MKKTKENAITLIILIITIVILLILASVTVAVLTGDNGILNNATKAGKNYSIKSVKEKIELAIVDLRVEKEINGNKLEKDDLRELEKNEIEVKDITQFPVIVICGTYKFGINKDFSVTYMGEADETEITYTTEPNNYTNQKKIKINIIMKNINGMKTLEYPNGDNLDLNDAKEKNIEYEVEKNGTYTFKVIDSKGKCTTKDIVINLIDTIGPQILNLDISCINEGFDIKIEAEDNEATEEEASSGIAKYEYFIDGSLKNTTTENSYSINGLIIDREYDIFVVVYDNAGNKTKSEKITKKAKQNIKFKTISAGYNHSIGIDENGVLWTWGDNYFGQLGNGFQGSSAYKLRPVKTTLEDSVKFSKISAGGDVNFAIDEEGNIWAWGYNLDGLIGIGGKENVLRPTQITRGTKFIQVDSGGYYVLAIDEFGNIWGWGRNSDGQIGNGTMETILNPTKITENTKFVKISAGSNHSLAIDENGKLWSWGGNSYGQLGDGSQSNKYIPTQVMTEHKFKDISAGKNTKSSVFIDENGELWACGYNYYGELGDGTKETITTPKKIQIEDGQKIEKACLVHKTCLLIDTNGELWACGDDVNLGDGTYQGKVIPTKIKSGINFKEISIRDSHRLALDDKGNLWDWGTNTAGQLGNGTMNSVNVPQKIFE